MIKKSGNPNGSPQQDGSPLSSIVHVDNLKTVAPHSRDFSRELGATSVAQHYCLWYNINR
nr:MAG TPA: hypothetical protein [Caudoviricetes sp.]